MVADDSKLVRSILRSLVQSNSDWQVCGEAENGSIAVQIAIELKPDLIVLDLTMPELSGLSAARQISVALPNTLILLHTMHAIPDLEVEAMKNGVTRVLPKSDGAQLVPVIQEMLSQRQTQIASQSVSQMATEGQAIQLEPTSPEASASETTDMLDKAS